MDKKNGNQTDLNSPLISIVVPIYKVEKYLKQCIESLINQTCQDTEIILVDDGSPDTCPRICDAYSLNHENIKVIHKPNGGLVSARKAGIQSASGEYICYVDGDDWITEEHIRTIAQEIKKTGADIIIHEFTFASAENTYQAEHDMKAGYYARQDIIHDILPTMLSTEPYYTFAIAPSVCTKVFRRSLLYPVQMNVPDSLTLGEDAAVTYPVILAADSISIIKEYGYMYRVNPQSMTRAYNKKLSQNAVTVIDYLLSWATTTEYVPVIMPQLQDYACYMFMETFGNEISGNHQIKQALDKLTPVARHEFIKQSLIRKKTPFKVKVCYFLTRYRLRGILSLIRLYWKKQ